MPEIIPNTVPAYQCRHIFTDGHRCGSKSLRAENFCYYHHTTRRPAPPRGLTYELQPAEAFDLPLPEDRSAVQAAIGEIIRRLAANSLDPRRAGLLLYALQIASGNLPKPAATPAETVQEITSDDIHGLLAPIAEFQTAPAEKNLEQILREQWARDQEAWDAKEAARLAREQAAEADVAGPDILPDLNAAAAASQEANPHITPANPLSNRGHSERTRIPTTSPRRTHPPQGTEPRIRSRPNPNRRRTLHTFGRGVSGQDHGEVHHLGGGSH